MVQNAVQNCVLSVVRLSLLEGQIDHQHSLLVPVKPSHQIIPLGYRTQLNEHLHITEHPGYRTKGQHIIIFKKEVAEMFSGRL